MVLTEKEYWTAWNSEKDEIIAFTFARKEITTLGAQAVIDKRIQELLGNEKSITYELNCYMIKNLSWFVDEFTHKNSGWKNGEPTHPLVKTIYDRIKAKSGTNTENKWSKPGMKVDVSSQYRPGDEIFVRLGNQGLYGLKWEGPYKILQQVAPGIFKVQSTDGSKTRTAHASNIKAIKSETGKLEEKQATEYNITLGNKKILDIEQRKSILQNNGFKRLEKSFKETLTGKKENLEFNKFQDFVDRIQMIVLEGIQVETLNRNLSENHEIYNPQRKL